MEQAIIGMGSNIGDREANLLHAVNALDRDLSVRVLAVSPVYRTAPMGPALYEFLNAAVMVETGLDPGQLLMRLQTLEREAGRPADHERWGPRLIDLDILLMGDRIQDGPPALPHPGLRLRDFVLAPILDLVPGASDPRDGASLASLLFSLEARTVLGEPGCLPSRIDCEVLEHTADVGIEVRSSTLDGLLECAVMALADVMVPRSMLKERARVEISLASPDRESLLVDLLGEVLFRVDTQRFVPLRASIRVHAAPGGWELSGALFGCVVDPAHFSLAVKAATHHRVAVVSGRKGGWTGRVYLDV